MMKTIFLCLLFSSTLSAQNISNGRLETIVKLIISNSPEIDEYILPAEYKTSNRFGITFQEAENKFFIANEFPENDEINRYDFKTSKLENEFYSLSIYDSSKPLSRNYYLKDSFVVSKPFYFSREWEMRESNHFRFFISDETLFNDYSIVQLEKFVDTMYYVLNFSEEQKNEIRQKKIYYFLCKDESEIKKISGFATRGIYILAQDYVITTYNTHYHELLHFLINYKLRKLPLYTHPFLQEGFAVAFGGRGGLEKHTIFETGVFLVISGFANYTELLNRNDFHNTDATISYPISGLYTAFLIKQIGIERFIDLYRKYSSSKDLSMIKTINKNDLPSEEKWILFVDSLVYKSPIKVPDKIDYNNFSLIGKKDNYEVYHNNDNYLFRVKDTLLISVDLKLLNYQSKIFNEHFPNRKYNSEKYLITVDQSEISIYNLYSNNLIGKYVASFSIPLQKINNKNGFYEFLVKKELLDGDLQKD